MSAVLIDTGPLIAYLNRRDQWHQWSAEKLSRLPVPLWTCESVLSEAWFLLRSVQGGQRAMLKLLERGGIRVDFNAGSEIHAVRQLLHRYDNVPMSFADACLVRLSELFDDCSILTLDGDFRVYRRFRNQKIPLVTPPEV